jgi:hypothetical protein
VLFVAENGNSRWFGLEMRFLVRVVDSSMSIESQRKYSYCRAKENASIGGVDYRQSVSATRCRRRRRRPLNEDMIDLYCEGYDALAPVGEDEARRRRKEKSAAKRTRQNSEEKKKG